MQHDMSAGDPWHRPWTQFCIRASINRLVMSLGLLLSTACHPVLSEEGAACVTCGAAVVSSGVYGACLHTTMQRWPWGAGNDPPRQGGLQAPRPGRVRDDLPGRHESEIPGMRQVMVNPRQLLRALRPSCLACDRTGVKRLSCWLQMYTAVGHLDIVRWPSYCGVPCAKHVQNVCCTADIRPVPGGAGAGSRREGTGGAGPATS